MFVGVGVVVIERVAVVVAETLRVIDGDPVIVRLALGGIYEYNGLSDTEIDGVAEADADEDADGEADDDADGEAVMVADADGLAVTDDESVIVGDAVREADTELVIDGDIEVDGEALTDAVGLGDGGAAHIPSSLSSHILNANTPARGCQFARRAVVDALHENGHSA